MLRLKDWEFYFQNAVMIIPLQRHSKPPLRGFSWKEFDMWEFDWDDHDGNIGIVCGQTNPEGTKRLCVVDLDASKQPPYLVKGFPAQLLVALEASGTLCVATARRGLHFYTYLPLELDITILRFGWGEVRCRDSYVVAPHSKILLPDGKIGQYEFVNLRDENFWDHVRDAPPELLALVDGRLPASDEPDPFAEPLEVENRSPFYSSPPVSYSAGGRVISIEPGPATISAILNGVREGESPCEGIRGRNDAAFHYTYYMLREGKKEQDAWYVLVQWNQRNKPPLPVKELTSAFKSACSYFQRKGGVVGVPEHVGGNGKLDISTVWERLKSGPERIEPVYYPLVFRGGITLLYGPPGEGKSFAMLRMAIATASRGFRVAYLSLEMAEPMVLSYLETIMKHENIEPSGELYVVYKESELFAIPDVDLIIIDALRTFRPGVDLNDSKQVEAFVQELRRNYGDSKGIILLHHTNKPALGPNAQEIDPRAMAEGSLRLVSASDIAAFFHRDTTVFLIDIVKSRYTATTTLKRKFPFPCKQIRVEAGEQIEW